METLRESMPRPPQIERIPNHTEDITHGDIDAIKKVYPYSPRFNEVEIEITDGEKTFPLNSLLPPQWKIYEGLERPAYNATTDPDTKRIIIPRNTAYTSRNNQGRTQQTIKPFLSRPGSFILILHEIGHSHRYHQQGIGDVNRNMNIRSFALPSLESLSDKRLAEYIDIVLNDERQAWTFALKQLRNIHTQQGLNLESAMSAQDIIQFTRDKLRGYTLDSTQKPLIDLKGKKISPAA